MPPSSRRATLPPQVSQQQQAPRIKRKPPPSIDLDARYPSPDPTDPFAPLWVLRNRSSNPSLSLAPSNDNLKSFNRASSYDLYSNILSFTHDDIPGPLQVLSNDKNFHYRRRSQSTPFTQLVPPLKFPSIQSSPLMFSLSERNDIPSAPSLITDNTSDSGSASVSGTETDISTPVSSSFPCSESTPRKLARLLLPRRTQSVYPSLEKQSPSVPKRIGKVAISSPIGVEHLAGTGKLLNDQAARSVNDLHSYQPPQPHYTPLRRTTSDARTLPRELDACLTRPEALYRARSPLSNSHTIEMVPPPLCTDSHSASYVHLPDLPSPIDDYESFTRPRTAPHPPPSSSSPYLRSLSQRQLKSRAAHSHPPPELLLPRQTEWAQPSATQLAYAASLPVIAESGVRVTFGSLFATQRTVVIFIRHFWCPLCQDYMSSLTSLAHPDMMYTTPPSSPSPGSDVKSEVEPVQLVVISNGAQAYLPKYRQLFSMPFSMYTDPSLALYVALGMGRDNARKSSSTVPSSPRANTHGNGRQNKENRVADSREALLDGGYVQHGLVRGIAMVVGRALKAGMPVWEKGGDINQLGGEFVFGPGLSCTYAHRMQSAKGHVPIRDVLVAAGINPRTPDFDMPATSSSDSYVSALRGLEAGSKNRLKKRRNTMQHLGAKVTGRKPFADSSSSGALTEGNRQPTTRMLSQEVQWTEGSALINLRQKQDFRRRTFVGRTVHPTNGGSCLCETGSCIIEEDTA